MSTSTTERPAGGGTIQQQARANAQWVAARLKAGTADDIGALLFLKWRPLREVEDVLDAAKRARLEDAVACLTDAAQLAKGHTGGPAPCPAGYTEIVYPVTDAERAELLQAAADATRMLRLPGTNRGFTWSSAVEVDPDAMTVVVTLAARHPTIEPPAEPVTA